LFKDPFDAEVALQFTHLVFGLHSSPAILGSVISKNLDKYQPQYPASIKSSFMLTIATIEEAFNTYLVAKKIMAEGGFNLRKWASNSPELVSN